ncbi:Acyl-CoA carboxylase epsilon subunit [Micrococcales bacterium KH10]|nr:Acyl-CoA carboxylase epsilon subunit [Micrococcales bacterium KH10]
MSETPDPAATNPWAGMRILRGDPTEDEIVALIAGLAATAPQPTPDPEEVSRPRERWRDPGRGLRMSPLGRKGGRGPDEWRWSLRAMQNW